MSNLSLGELFPTFRRVIVDLSQSADLADEGVTNLHNVCSYSPSHSATEQDVEDERTYSEETVYERYKKYVLMPHKDYCGLHNL